ncbi:fimbrial biogenesis chaperone [Sphingopyxis terrae]|uniref:fimbrial biogenesis chaperone n=1 Tax=Sphingopyxis terrae TaxID=33052 RepID=UPI002A12306D|nr:molecular chaperone [Sphingopyxis terrae]MDX8357596.1 molecular chaperone [Sphingopyxis terrae]
MVTRSPPHRLPGRHAAAALGLFFSSVAAAQTPSALLIWPVNPVIEAEKPATALWLENPGKTSISLQIRIFAWEQRGGENVYAAQDRIIGSPPIVTIAPGAKQLVRLTRLTPPAAEAEASYRIIVDEIPAARSGDTPGASVSFRMRYSLPLFAHGSAFQNAARATALTPALSWRMIEADGQKWIEIENWGDVHARLVDAALLLDDRKIPLAHGLLGYVLAQSSARWPVPKEATEANDFVAGVDGDTPSTIPHATGGKTHGE